MTTQCWKFLTFWSKTLFEVKVFNPIAFEIQRHYLSKCYTINETKKKGQYNETVLQADHGVSPFLLLCHQTEGLVKNMKDFIRGLHRMNCRKAKAATCRVQLAIPNFGVSTTTLNTTDVFRSWCKLNFGPLRGYVKSCHFPKRIDARRQ